MNRALACVVCVAVVLVVWGTLRTTQPQPQPQPQRTATVVARAVGVEGQGHDVLLAVPASGHVKGLLLLFHGCGHSGADWFSLPEDNAMVRIATNRGLAVAAFTSTDRQFGCWEVEEDGPRVKKAVIAVLHALHPFRGDAWALGASSGGMFVSALPNYVPIAGVAVAIAPGYVEVLRATKTPAAFIYMSGDTTWASDEAITAAVSSLVNDGVPAIAFRCDPKPLHAAYFSAHIDGLSAECSTALFRSLHDHPGVRVCRHVQNLPRGMAT
eukprot:TRINITY_DN10539_c0_g3_i2.p1 TRINITY_DN10539_c0_g3~~TRINITY_DN10539_c0_g3_i2.p1  ORF type:complete len:269 (+),score=47.97 TRINITY_DN10539_c0_g3_i2:78-884(+)